MSDSLGRGVEQRGDAIIVHVDGRLEAMHAKELLKQCESILAKGHSKLVIHLADVEFIASSGIGTLLALCEDSQEKSISVRLAELSPAVQSVVDLLNLSDFLPIDGSTDAALAALAA